MGLSLYARLIGLTAGALLHLFLLALIVGHRRPRRFERVLFFLILALFFFYAGALLAVNAGIHYGTPPAATSVFANALVLLGLGLLPGLLLHSEVEFDATLAPDRVIPIVSKLLVGAFYLPLAYFGLRIFPLLVARSNLQFLWTTSHSAQFFGVWLGLALLTAAVMEIRGARGDSSVDFGKIHRYLAATLGVLAILALAAYGLGLPLDPHGFSIAVRILLFLGLAPGAILGYFVVRRNFLQIGMQRNLIYAVSAAFLALLYLALVRRLSGWFEAVLPPEATAAILLFLLVFTFEPLERVIGHTLYRSFQERMDRTKKLVAQLQAEAQSGELARFISRAEQLIRDELGLAVVRISIPALPNLVPLRSPGGLGHSAQLPLKNNANAEFGLLEACTTGAVIVGEASVALEFLAEQIPTLVRHCQLIQEKISLERELAERERLALVGQMAASISHNLRNPLGSMKTVVQVLLEDRGLTSRVRQDCEIVVQEIDRLSKKLTQLLQFAKPSVRPGESAGNLDVVSLTEQMAGLLRHEAERRGVRLQFQSNAARIVVQGVDEAWRDVISNLVVNAIEAQPTGGRVAIAIEGSDSTATVEISDEGPGVSADLRNRIFQPFFTTKASGTGLGLAIVSRRVSEMNGEIRCESPAKNGRGTRFIISVPASKTRFAAGKKEVPA
ncbi:MAG TPA: ATP-binding protein [Candidatus Acidoferrales bacterium]|nr:ATP-binding protein [Candidatus Acidoferrales bacterium]